MYLANREKVKNLTLYEGLALVTSLYNETKHSCTKLAPRSIIFGNSTSLNPDDINSHKMKTIRTARDNIAKEASIQNSKIDENEEKYQRINQKQVLVKSKGKPSPYTNRYRLIDIKTQTDKTVTDEHDIKIHKLDMKKP